MRPTLLLCTALLLVATAARGDEVAAASDDTSASGDKRLSGMSIVGNDDAPKSLVIVPWKSSGLGDTLDVGSALDDGRNPVDRDVFMRELGYYQIRSGSASAGNSGKQ
jgi:hypothetical protein